LRLLAAVALCAALAACKVELYSDLSEQEANEMLAALSAQQIPASKQALGEGRWQLQVEQSDLGTALQVLRANGLPQERLVSLGDVFQKQGLVSTPAEERMRYIHALSQELSQTLRQIDGVVAARVHVVIPANDPLSDKIRPSSAAVMIKHDPAVDLRVLVPAVKDMVAHSIEGLSHDQVSLTLFEARHTAPARATAPPDARTSLAPAFLDVLPPEMRWLVLTLLAGGIAALAVLPTLLKRQRIDLRTWLRRVWPAR
jgi:type III secretion protein J